LSCFLFHGTLRLKQLSTFPKDLLEAWGIEVNA
jgi:hypothetical protein